MHFIAIGCGYVKCGAAIPRLGLLPAREGWDKSVCRGVGKDQLMRVLGASKAGENRPLTLLRNDATVGLRELGSNALRLFEQSIIQNIAGESLIGRSTIANGNQSSTACQWRG